MKILDFILAFYCTRNGTDGRVVSIDLRGEHSEIAKNNLKRVNLATNVDFRVGDITTSSILPEENFFDAAFIDMPTPYFLLATVQKAIQYGSSIMIFLPNWYQVEQTIEKALDLELTLINVFETNRRPMEVKPEKHIMRPVFRSLVYSGIIIHLMKTKKLELDPQKKFD